MLFTHNERIAGFRNFRNLLDISAIDKQESSSVVSGAKQDTTTCNIPSGDSNPLKFLNKGAYLGDLSDAECVCDAESSTEGPPRTCKNRFEKPKKLKKRKKSKKRYRLEFLVEACRLIMLNEGVVDDSSDLKSSVTSL